MKKILSISIIIFWGLFLVVDKLWNEVIRQAVTQKMGLYGEAFGPLSYFRPIILFIAVLLTLCLTIINIKK